MLSLSSKGTSKCQFNVNLCRIMCNSTVHTCDSQKHQNTAHDTKTLQPHTTDQRVVVILYLTHSATAEISTLLSWIPRRPPKTQSTHPAWHKSLPHHTHCCTKWRTLNQLRPPPVLEANWRKPGTTGATILERPPSVSPRSGSQLVD